MPKKEQPMIRIDSIETRQKLSFMARALGKSRVQFIKELTDNLFEVLGEHTSANLTYESRVSSGILQIQVLPKETYHFQIPVASLGVVSAKSKTEIPVSSLAIAKDEKFPKKEVEKND